MSGESSKESELSGHGLSWQNPPATVDDGLKALGNTIGRGVLIFDQIQADIKEENFEQVADNLNQFFAMLTAEYKSLRLANKSFNQKSTEVERLRDQLTALKDTLTTIDSEKIPNAESIAQRLSSHLDTLKEGLATTNDLGSLATSKAVEDLSAKIPSIAGLATTNDLENLATSKNVEDLSTKIPSVAGLATSKGLEDLSAKIPSVAGLATSDDIENLVERFPSLAGLARSEELNDLAKKLPSTEGLARSGELKSLATSAQLDTLASKLPSTAGLAKSTELTPLATSAQLDPLAKSSQLEGLAKTENLQQLATKKQVETLSENIPSVAGLARTEDLERLATNQQVQTLSDEMPSTTGLARSEEINNLATEVGKITAKLPTGQLYGSVPMTDWHAGHSAQLQRVIGRVTSLPSSAQHSAAMETLGLHVSAEVGTLPKLQDIHQGLATSKQIEDLETKIPSTTGLATTQDIRELEQKLPKTDGLATSQNIQNLESALPKAEDIRKGLATSAEVQEAVSQMTPPSLSDIRKDLITETQLKKSLGQVSSTLEEVPDKVVERLLSSDNFKTAVQHPSFPAVNELQRGLATQTLVQGVPQAVRAALLNPSSDPDSGVQPPALVTMQGFDAFKTEIRQELQSLPKGVTMDEIKAHLDERARSTSGPPPPAGVTAAEFTTFKDEIQGMINAIPTPDYTLAVTLDTFNTFKDEIKGMIQAIPTAHPVPSVTPNTLNTFKEEVKQQINSIPQGPTLEQIATLLQSQFRQQPQTGTGTTSGAQDATSSTTQSASTSELGNQPSNTPEDQGATASSTQSAFASQAQDQATGAVRPERPATSQTGFTFEPPHSDNAQVRNPFSSSTGNVASSSDRVQEQDTRSVGDKRPLSPTAEQSEAQKMARTIDNTIQEGNDQEDNARGTTEPGSSTTQTPARSVNESYLVIDVSTRGRVADSCLDQVFKELAEGSWTPPRDMDNPNIEANSWLGKLKTCIQRETKQKLAAGRPNYDEGTYTSSPRCYIGEIQKKPCVSEAGEKWAWTDHDRNRTCPACSTAHPEFKSHQCLKVKDENTLWLLNPTPENINTQKNCDDKYRGVPRGDVAPGASRGAGPGPGPGGPGPGTGGAGGPGGPASGGPASGGPGSRRGGRPRGLSGASVRTLRSRTSRGGNSETHDDIQPPMSPSKARKSMRAIRSKLHLPSKASKSETEARFEDMFAERPEQSASGLPFRPGTLSTSHSVNFDTLQTRPMDPSKSGKLQRSKSGGNLLNALSGYINPTNWLSRSENSNLASESRVGLLASEQNGGLENGHANGAANGHANGHHDDHLNGHNRTNENGSFEDPLGAGDMFPTTRGTSSHHFGTI
ncbi:hypothetical protein KCU78_g1443, partial [Aureobasidium melanogenum]